MLDSEKPTIIDVMRHGKPEGGEIFRGKTDMPLSKEGFAQMHSAYEKLRSPARIISSPMLRCVKFAETLASSENLPLSTELGLTELSFGDWDGKAIDWVKANDTEAFNRFWQDPVNFTPPNGEPMGEFQQRVTEVFWQQVKKFQHQHLLMVAHGGVIRVILSEILKTDALSLARFEVPYACVSQIRIYHHGSECYPQLVFHNA